MRLKVLLVEDDHLQRDSVKRDLEEGAGADVETRSTEWDFQSTFDAVAATPPDVVVLDMMLRWTNPRPGMQPAPKEVTDMPQKAGVRCARMLRGDPRTKDVSVILYSVLGSEDLGEAPPEDMEWIVKEPDTRNLIDIVNRIAQRLGRKG